MDNELIICKKCSQQVLISDFIVRVNRCRHCYNKSANNYYKENRNKINQRRRLLWQQNKEKMHEKTKEYYNKNKERIKINNLKSIQKNRDKILTRKRAYYLKNKEIISQKAQKYYQENCMSIRERCFNYYHKNKDKVQQRYNQPKSLFNAMKNKAKQRSLEFSLSLDDFLSLTSQPCIYCGEKLGRTGIDRIDSSKGYEISNCAPACIVCNTSKMDIPLKEWLERIKKVLIRYENGHLDKLF